MINEINKLYEWKLDNNNDILNINNIFKSLVKWILSWEIKRTGKKLLINDSLQKELSKNWKSKKNYNIYQKIFLLKEIIYSLDDFNLFYSKLEMWMEKFITNYKKEKSKDDAVLFLLLFINKAIILWASEEQIKNLKYHYARLLWENTKIFFEDKTIDLEDLKKNWKDKKVLTLDERVIILDLINTKEDFYIFYNSISRTLSLFAKYYKNNKNKEKILIFFNLFSEKAKLLNIDWVIISRLELYQKFIKWEINSLKNYKKGGWKVSKTKKINWFKKILLIRK